MVKKINLKIVENKYTIKCPICNYPIITERIEHFKYKYKICPSCKTEVNLGTYPGVRP